MGRDKRGSDMTEHRRNILVTECLEANTYYNAMLYRNLNGKVSSIGGLIAEAYLMRAETVMGII